MSHEGYIPTADGLRLHYRIIGNGPEPVVIPSGYWLAEELGPLAEGRTLFFYDQRNRGDSDAVADTAQIGVEHEVRDVEAVRRYFGLERMALVGWSYNGGVVALYAAHHPERVNRLVLIGPIPLRRNEVWEPDQAALEARLDPVCVKRLEELEQAGIEDRDPVAYCREHLKVYMPLQMGNISAISRMRSDPCQYRNEWVSNRTKAVEPLFAAIRDRDWRPQARTITAPMLVIHGIDDPIHVEYSREWAAAVPNGRLTVIDGAGHFPWIEAPEQFFAVVEEFL
jgi:pimeloyl-ACP methyl ester carboxylesterase